MVKNLGGNKSKRCAHKDFVKKDSTLRTSEEEAEVYAQVSKIYGGTMCQVISVDGVELLCHIRGKFSRSRGKRDNYICVGVWVLVGKREWEKEDPKGIKVLNCDLLEVYNDKEKLQLKNTITHVNWSRFIANDIKLFGKDEEDSSDVGFSFGDEKTQEYQELIQAQIATAAANGGTTNIITTDDGELIDVDDI